MTKLEEDNVRLQEEVASLQDRVKHLSKTKTQRDYNELSIQNNALRKENQELKDTLENMKQQLQTHKKSKSVLMPTSNSKHNVLEMMMKTPSRPRNHLHSQTKQTQQTQSQAYNPTSMIDLTQATSEPKSDTTDIVQTQFSIEEDQENIPPQLPLLREEESINETMFASEDLIKTTRRDSLDLGAGNFHLFSSSQPNADSLQKKYTQFTDIGSSPVKVKQEAPIDEIVEDSEYDSEHEIALPTPVTSKKYQTPANKVNVNNTRKRGLFNLQTPAHDDDDVTPMKKTRIAKDEPRELQIPSQSADVKTESQSQNIPALSQSPVQTQISSQDSNNTGIIDFTTHPKKNRAWIDQDFKVNPSKNAGEEHAYHVVVRGAARRCIHGTTCRDCDKFYAAQGDIPDNYNGPKWDSNSSDFDIVKTTSRHRDLWGEFVPPAGFGEFDFPTTQQRKEQREINRLRALKSAHERLYSALNGGKWIFRDEEFNDAVREKRFTVDRDVFLKYLDHAPQ